jgi:hypothetical protein
MKDLLSVGDLRYKKQTKVIHKLDTVNNIRESERNILNKGALLFVVKSYEWL